MLLWPFVIDGLEENQDEVDEYVQAVAFLGRYGGQTFMESERMRPRKFWRYVEAVATLLKEEGDASGGSDP